MFYKRLCKHLNDYGKLIPVTDDVYSHIESREDDYYLSIFEYTEEQKRQFDEKGSIKGVGDTSGNTLLFDFDDKENLSNAYQDSCSLIVELLNHGLKEEEIRATFTGNKGFQIELTTAQKFSNKEARDICFGLAGNLQTFDTTMYDANQINRVEATKHQKSNLYKIPLTLDQFNNLSIDEIKELATNDNTVIMQMDLVSLRRPIRLPLSITKFKDVTVVKKVVKDTATIRELSKLDWSEKPKFLSNCRFALQNGFFEEGDRSTALLCLASTYKNLGFKFEHVGRILKGVAELQAERNDTEKFPNHEIWVNICKQVFSGTWNNGQYTCRETNNWLNLYCQDLGPHKCNHREDDNLKPQKLIDIADPFREYVVNIDKNTIHTGLPSIDELVFLSTGANVGIIGAPGSGKTSIALELLNNTSKKNVPTVFASLDMAKTRIFEKICYRVTGLDRKELYHKFQVGEEGEILSRIEEEFGNVNFFKKSSPTVEDIKDYVNRCQDELGVKIKLVMVDYFERVSSDMNDDTAASKRVSGELQDLVDDLDVCLITLVQPNKNALSGGPDQPIYDYTKIKGSSFVYQAFRIIMSCWRPFYNPKDFSKDHYMQMAVLKNDLGELGEMAFNWNGKEGKISEMEQHQKDELRDMLRSKQEQLGEQKDRNW